MGTPGLLFPAPSASAFASDADPLWGPAPPSSAPLGFWGADLAAGGVVLDFSGDDVLGDFGFVDDEVDLTDFAF